MDPYTVTPPPYPRRTRGSAPAEPPRAVRGLATALTVLLAIMVVVVLLDIVALLLWADMADRIVRGEVVTADTETAANVFSVLTGGIELLLMAAIAVVFIVWQYRHAKNAQLLGSFRKLGPGWAIGGWFVPLANLFLPAMQIFGASRHSDIEGVGIRYEGGRGAPIVVWWAIAFGLGQAITNGAAGMAPEWSTVGAQYYIEMAASDRLEAAGNVVLVVAAVLAIAMVRSLTARQDAAVNTALADRIPPAAGPAQTW